MTPPIFPKPDTAPLLVTPPKPITAKLLPPPLLLLLTAGAGSPAVEARAAEDATAATDPPVGFMPWEVSSIGAGSDEPKAKASSAAVMLELNSSWGNGRGEVLADNLRVREP